MVWVVSAAGGCLGSGRGIGEVCAFWSRIAIVVVRQRCSAYRNCLDFISIAVMHPPTQRPPALVLHEESNGSFRSPNLLGWL